MNLIEAVFYFSVWTIISSAIAMVIAVSFFGYGLKEITEEEYHELLDRDRD
jgi:hypothetical protein